MLKSKLLLLFVEDVPSQWIFEHYLKLNESLTGQSVNIKSVFNSENTPSMYIYPTGDVYRFKDFSSSQQGTGIDLVMKLYNLTFQETAHKIVEDYKDYLSGGGVIKPLEKIIQEDRYKVVQHTIRPWQDVDGKYWTQFGIGSGLLGLYNVKPLSTFTMSRTSMYGQTEEFVVERSCMYGYFDKDGNLYKIYTPGYKKKKFIKVNNYVQGHDQLIGARYLVICSSLKDLMSLKAMKFGNIDLIAADSENTILTKEQIELYKSMYDNICTLFDDDAAGLKSMMRYEREYGIPYVHFQMEKDIADAVRDHGLNNARIVLFPMLKKVLTNKL